MTRHERYNRSAKGKSRSDAYRATPKGRRSRLREVIRYGEARIHQIQEELISPGTV